MPPTTSLTRTLTRLPALRGLRFSSSGKPDKSTHTTRKQHELDVQSHSSKKGMRDRETNQNDTTQDRGKGQDPKKDNPKAPEPVIGMQDENTGSKFTR